MSRPAREYPADEAWGHLRVVREVEARGSNRRVLVANACCGRERVISVSALYTARARKSTRCRRCGKAENLGPMSHEQRSENGRKGQRTQRHQRLLSKARSLRSMGIRPESAHEGWTRYGAEPEPCGIVDLLGFRRALTADSLGRCGTYRAVTAHDDPSAAVPSSSPGGR